MILTDTVLSQSFTSKRHENEYGAVGSLGSLPDAQVEDSALLIDAHPNAPGSITKSAFRP